jgi:mono/diheme cytochrome c family protein
VVEVIATTLRQCDLSHQEGFASHYREFIEYVNALSLEQQPDHELGFIVPDKQYFEETRQYVQIPEFLLNPDFLRAVSRYETLGRAKAFLRQLNSQRDPSEQLIFFSYTSRHLGTPDNDDSFRRLLIVVPGNAGEGVPEKWVQFGVTDPGQRVRIRNVSVISAAVNSDGTNTPYFKDFFRTYRRDGSITLKGRWELGAGDDNCAQCHKSGILPIFPEDGSVSADEQAAVQAVNQRFLSYGTPRFGKYLDPSVFGPGLGMASTADRNNRFGEHFDGTVVAHAMNCAACHQREGLGSFNWPMDSTLINSFVEGGQMPRGYTLRDAERTALYEKLIQEYFATDNTQPGILKSWLSGKLR